MSQFMCWFLLLTLFGRLSSHDISVERGKSVILFRNVCSTDNQIALYINGKKKNTLIVTWTIVNTTITANWMPDVMANYSKIFMDSMRNIQIADADENYEGKYSILNCPGAEVELIILPCVPSKYGPHCEHNCQCIEDRTVRCDSQTGHCLCKPGWQGIYCSEPCPFSYYGENCSKACSCHNNGNCSHLTGQCECQIGYKGDRCEDRCDEGTFGLNCQGKCNCQTGTTCEPHSGNCLYTTGDSQQLESEQNARYMHVIIGLLSAFMFIVVLYMVIKNIKVIRKKWKKCCKTQENVEGPDPIEVQGETDPVPPREPNTSVDNSGETSPLLSENQASDSASKLSGETDPHLPGGIDPHLLRGTDAHSPNVLATQKNTFSDNLHDKHSIPLLQMSQSRPTHDDSEHETKDATTVHQPSINSEAMREFQELRDEALCKICFVNKKNMVFIPCNHVVTCANCSTLEQCPVCRVKIEQRMKISF